MFTDTQKFLVKEAVIREIETFQEMLNDSHLTYEARQSAEADKFELEQALAKLS